MRGKSLNQYALVHLLNLDETLEVQQCSLDSHDFPPVKLHRASCQGQYSSSHVFAEAVGPLYRWRQRDGFDDPLEMLRAGVAFFSMHL